MIMNTMIYAVNPSSSGDTLSSETATMKKVKLFDSQVMTTRKPKYRIALPYKGVYHLILTLRVTNDSSGSTYINPQRSSSTSPLFTWTQNRVDASSDINGNTNFKTFGESGNDGYLFSTTTVATILSSGDSGSSLAYVLLEPNITTTYVKGYAFSAVVVGVWEDGQEPECLTIGA